MQNLLKQCGLRTKHFDWTVGDPTTHLLWYWQSVSEYRTILALLFGTNLMLNNTGFS